MQRLWKLWEVIVATGHGTIFVLCLPFVIALTIAYNTGLIGSFFQLAFKRLSDNGPSMALRNPCYKSDDERHGKSQKQV